MSRKAMASLVIAVAGAAGAAIPIAAFGGQPNNAHNKVTICHATGSKSNPYVRITPDAAGVVAGHAAHQDQRDIIPPFDYYDSGGTLHHFPGQNWTAEGQAIFNNGCKAPKPGRPGTPPPPSTTPVTTVTVPGATTTVTVNQPTPGPTKTVTVVVKKQVTVIRKIHARVTGSATPKATG